MKSLLLLFVMLPVCRYLLEISSVESWIREHQLTLLRAGEVLCLLLLGLTIGGGLLTAAAERIIIHDEATVLAIAAAFRHGQPMYPASTAPVEYGILYGPATYLVYLPPMLLGAKRIGLYQIWVVLALAAACLLVYLTARQLLTNRLSMLAITACLPIFVSHTLAMEWAIKGDVWVLLFSALGIWHRCVAARGWLPSSSGSLGPCWLT